MRAIVQSVLVVPGYSRRRNALGDSNWRRGYDDLDKRGRNIVGEAGNDPLAGQRRNGYETATSIVTAARGSRIDLLLSSPSCI